MAKSKVKGLIGNPPKGFKPVPVSGGFGVTHDFKVEPILEGLCVAIREDVGKNNQSVMEVKTDKGLRTVWGSAQLSGLFEVAKPGKTQVYIHFIGTQKLKGKKMPMKLFECYTK